jgi:hypothetical protein
VLPLPPVRDRTQAATPLRVAVAAADLNYDFKTDLVPSRWRITSDSGRAANSVGR